ncbi:NUDIX domain-containing protein [archaeon]|nr:MAG: NUDIX domain-containing protein [archaeon]
MSAFADQAQTKGGAPLPTPDVPVLLRLQHYFQRHVPSVHTGSARASVALILRVTAPQAEFDGIPDGAFMSSRLAAAARADDVQILFIKRAVRETDAWSGNVAFPGGQQEAGESDWDTSVRETAEEVGLDLRSGPFHYLGRLNDSYAYNPRKKRTLVLSRFVFVQTCKITPPLMLCADEVAAVRWAPLSLFAPARMTTRSVSLPGAKFSLLRSMPAWLRTALGFHTVYFPGIELPYSGAGTAALPPLLTKTTVTSMDRPDLQFQLWGITLASLCDCLAAAGLPRVSRPPFTGDGLIAHATVMSLHGMLEVWEVMTGHAPVYRLFSMRVALLMTFLLVCIATSASLVVCLLNVI